MSDPSIFISSCSRRQLARRRPTPTGYHRVQLVLAMIVLVAAILAFVAMRVGI